MNLLVGCRYTFLVHVPVGLRKFTGRVRSLDYPAGTPENPGGDRTVHVTTSYFGEWWLRPDEIIVATTPTDSYTHSGRGERGKA